MTVHYSDDAVTLHHGDCLDVLRSLPDCSVDSVVTDPPYGIGFMGQKWDTYANESGRAASTTLHKFDHVGGNHNPSNAADAARTRRAEARRFGEWCEVWTAECLRVLRPGGHMVAFGGSRTWHRLAAAVEDAGFEIRDSIAWLYGSGFPKSLDVSKAIDKRPGVSMHREFGVALRDAMTQEGFTNTFDVAERVTGRRTGAVANWIKYQFPEAKWWPALRDLLGMDEATWGPVIAESERARTGQHLAGLATGPSGVGAAGEGAPRRDVPSTVEGQRWQGWGTALKPAFEPIVVGRKPIAGTVAANVLEHGTGALNIDATRTAHASDADLAASQAKNPGRTDLVTSEVYGAGRGQQSVNDTGRWPTNVLLDDSQADDLDRQNGVSTSRMGKPRGASSGDGWRMTSTGSEHADSGGPSRYFPTFHYEAKAPTSERPRLWRHACECEHDEPMRPKGTCPACGTAGELVAHPTVKPLDLMRWLVRLVTPPGGVVLEPFAGSGTTAEACVVENMRCIAIEREADYLPLIVARLDECTQSVLLVPGAGL